jgi:hypothetical protein
MAGDPAKLAQLMRENGYSDDDIVAKLKEVRSSTPAVSDSKWHGDIDVGDIKTGQDYKDYLAAGNKPPEGYQFKLPSEEARDFAKFGAGSVGGELAGMAIGKGIGALGRLIKGSEGAAARDLTEAHGGTVGVRTPQSGIPETEGITPSRNALGAVSRSSAQKIREELAAQFETNYGAPSRAARNMVETEPPAAPPRPPGPWRSPLPDEAADTGGVPVRSMSNEPTAITQNKWAGPEGEQKMNQMRSEYASRRPSPMPPPVNTETQRVSIHSAMAPREIPPQVPVGAPADQLRDITPLRSKIAELAYSDRTPTHVVPHLKAELDRLDALRAPDGRVFTTERSLNDIRGRYQDLADYGVPGGPGTGSTRDRAFKEIAATARSLVDEGPYAKPNQIYSEGMGEMRTDRQLLGLKAKPGKSVTAEDKAVALALRSAGNDAEAAGSRLAPGALQQFRLRHPELGRQIDAPDLLRAKDTLSFGLGGGHSMDNLIQATAAGKRSLGHKAIDLGLSNLQAANGRLLYKPAEAAIAAEPQMPHLMQQMAQAAQAKRMADAHSIAVIFGKPPKQDEDQSQGP